MMFRKTIAVAIITRNISHIVWAESGLFVVKAVVQIVAAVLG
jgi:hypothetical protein